MQRVFSGQLALGGLGEKLLQQTLALVTAGLVINPGCRLCRRSVGWCQQGEKGGARFRRRTPEFQLKAQGFEVSL